MKTETVRTSHLRNDEHFQFNTEFRDLVDKTGPATLKIQSQYDAFLSAFSLEDEALKKIMKSAITADIQAADHVRDVTFRGMAGAAKAALDHFNTDVQAAAKRLKIVFDTYGNVANKPLNEETSAIYNLLQELKGPYAADVSRTGLTDWVAELEANNSAFDKLVKDRYDESAARTGLVLKEVRLQVDAAYRTVTERIDALLLIEGDKVYEDFIRQLNVIIEKYKNTIAQRQGRKAAKTAAPETVTPEA